MNGSIVMFKVCCSSKISLYYNVWCPRARREITKF